MTRWKTRKAARVAAVAAVMIVAGASLAGCSSGGGDSEGKVTLRFTWWGNDTRAALTREVLDDFTALHPNIEVVGEPVATTDSYWTKLSTAAAAGDAADIITLGGEGSRQYAESGVMLDLNEVSDTLDLSKFDQGVLDTATIDGKLFGLPTGANALGLLVNTDIFDAAGVPLPDDTTWTWDDYVRIANEISANSPDGTYGVEQDTEDTLGFYSYQRGEPLYTADGEMGTSEQTLADYWTMSRELLDGGGMPSAETTNELEAVANEQSLFGTGNAAMRFVASNLIDVFTTSSGGHIEVMMPPGEHEFAQPGISSQAAQYWGINARSEHPKEAAMLLDYLLNDEAAAQKLLVDRGVPYNPDMLAAMDGLLTPTQQETADFIARIAEEGSPSQPIPPAGAGSVSDIQRSLNSEVLFGSITPQEAAKQYVEQVTELLK